MTVQFQIGQTYYDRSICDHNCIFQFTVLARTAKTITTTVSGKVVKRGLSTWEGVEQFKPFGSYSMCSIVSADRTTP
jgi:predicted anti-sigma-YlaC factor YlaD